MAVGFMGALSAHYIVRPMNEHSSITELNRKAWPPLLAEMTDPPKALFIRGALPDPSIYRYLCVVGSRKFSEYGKAACEKLIAGLAGHAVVIVSGLALGIDAIAHRAALEAGIPTIAFPGYGLADSEIYPQSHMRLAQEILHHNGALISEHRDIGALGEWHFPRRNRIMAGISHATLIIEAGKKSGTLITAGLALSYDRSVLVVPGPLFSPNHQGSNALLRDGAQIITSSDDILEALGLTPSSEEPVQLSFDNLSTNERTILSALNPSLSFDDLVRTTGIATSEVSITVSMMELKGIVTHRLGKIERVR